MTSQEIQEKFVKFFEEKGHKRLPASTLIPDEVDSSVLFTSAGMQQFKNWFSGKEKAKYDRVVTIQPCLRTSDIDEVGDETHLTFFEMLGNFSFGKTRTDADFTRTDAEKPYFKKEAIELAFEFLTDEKWLGIKKERISATYFERSKAKRHKEIKTDNESKEVLQGLEGLTDIVGEGDDNFWTLGTEGSPGGPTVEFYAAPSEALAREGRGIEVWNLVFNEFLLKDGKWVDLPKKGVDTGMGLERIAAVMQGKSDVFETDIYEKMIKKIEEILGSKYTENKRSFRIVADHVRASVPLVLEGIEASNTQQGYILRRLIRRAIRYIRLLGTKESVVMLLGEVITKNKSILKKMVMEENKFRRTMQKGLKKTNEVVANKTSLDQKTYSQVMQTKEKKEIFRSFYRNKKSENGFLKKGINVSNKDILNATIIGKESFDLYQTYGFPIEMIVELAQEKRLFVDIEDFRIEAEKHQKKSRASLKKQFKGGLSDQTEATTKLHTATHLLLAALRQVLGEHVEQKGSNINPERLRFDFSHPEKVTPEEQKKVEDLVNAQIEKGIEVKFEEMSPVEAKKSGAVGVFEHKYGDKIKVYSVGDPSTGSGPPFSREICGGPHVKNTGELEKFKILKEESSSAGVRRIKAVLD